MDEFTSVSPVQVTEKSVSNFECYYSLQIGILDKVAYCLLLEHAVQPTVLLQIPSDPHFKGAVCSVSLSLT